MKSPLERTQRTYIKLILASFAALVLIVLVCWGSIRFYHNWQEGKLVRRAAAILSGGDLKAASLVARRALQLNPDNVDATRVMAEIAEKSGDRTAVDWRRKVLELNPNSTDDVLALTRTAMRANDLVIAETALNSIADQAASKPEYHAARGRLLEIRNDVAAAEASWVKAAELAPQNLNYRFQLALMRLNSRDPEQRQQALRVLEELRKEPAQRVGAMRTLIVDGVAHRGDPQMLVAMAKQLQAFPEAPFSDRILYLELLRQTRAPEYEPYLAGLKTTARAVPADLAALLSWMIRNGIAGDAVPFVRSLPPEEANKWPVPLATAEALAQTKAWSELESLTRSSHWQGFNFLRRAYLARACRSQEKELAAEQEFTMARKEASVDPQLLAMLAQSVAEWGWEAEATEMLWTLTKFPETQSKALTTLYQHYTRTADTSGLYRTLRRLLEINPNDIQLRNNFAQVALLLNADGENARKMAAEVAAVNPANGGFASTHAFALMTNGDVEGALAVMNSLSPEQLADPSVAMYYGIILAAAGQKEKAREFLARSEDAVLLPEEKALVVKAQSSLK